MAHQSDTSDAGDSDPEVPLDVIPLHSTTLLTVLDETGVIQYESPSIEAIYGFDQDDLVGEQVAGYFHPSDREEVVGAFRRVVESEEYTVEAVEYRHERADGSYCWVESVASTNPTPEGYYVVNTREISERKERERELERTNERLGEFATVVSHDLRNPLTVAQLRLELAMEACASEYLEDVEHAHDRMDALIEDLLTLSRAGDRLDSREVLDLGEVAQSCWRTVATGDTTLETDVDGELVADRSRLKQLLGNLIRNAIEHGSADVTLTVGKLDDRPGFYVEDDGPGIPGQDRDRLFETGYTTKPKGTGLGLTIVREIAEAHGWEIAVTESASGGTRFEFSGVDVET